MINLGLALQILITYLALSREGKHFLNKVIKKSRRVNKTLAKPVSFNLQKILYFIKNLKVCDKVL